jgi:hypothetical protein
VDGKDAEDGPELVLFLVGLTGHIAIACFLRGVLQKIKLKNATKLKHSLLGIPNYCMSMVYFFILFKLDMWPPCRFFASGRLFFFFCRGYTTIIKFTDVTDKSIVCYLLSIVITSDVWKNQMG